MLFLAVAPTSLFFGAVYSESLFLLLAVAAFLARRAGAVLEGRTSLAGLALLTRSAGVALLPALARVRLAGSRPATRTRGRCAGARCSSRSIRCSSQSWIGHPLAFLEAQKVVWERRLSPAGPLGGVVAAVQERELLDLGVAVALIVLGVVAWRRIGAAYGLYTLVSVALPLSFVSDKVPLWSMQRFAVVVFPAFMALATLDPRQTRRARDRDDSRRLARRVCGQMGPVVLGCVIESEIRAGGVIDTRADPPGRQPGRLVAWSVLVGLLAAASYAGRLAGGEPPDDVLYLWSTFAGALIQYAVMLDPDPGDCARLRPSPPRARGSSSSVRVRSASPWSHSS